MSPADGPRSRRNPPLAIGGALAFAALCGLPYLRWWAHPSLFDDDFLRVASLQHFPLGSALFRPFNEHMAPLFEVVSWLAWVAAGRSVSAVPLAFQAASFLAAGATALVLAAWVRREVGSRTAALAAVALFALSAVSAEAVLWYSASSFQWAAAVTLFACLAASRSADAPTSRGRGGWSLASALASLAAPAFSAIGILAGVAAAVRIASDSGRSRSLPRRLAWSLVPLAGTAGYLAVCEQFRYRDLISASVRRGFEPAAATWATLRAPAAVLIPGLAGLPEQSRAIPGLVLATTTALGLVAALAWSAKSGRRPFLLTCLVLLVGGYLTAYATRARPGDLHVFEIRRYHLFPQIGLVGLIVAAASTRLRGLDDGPGRGLVASACLAGGLAVIQYPAMGAESARAYRYPDQPRAIEAAGRLGRICDREGITLAQAMTALEPIRTPWFPNPWPFNTLLNLLPPLPASPRLADAEVRGRLLDGLRPDDLECLFGGMEATRYASPAPPSPGWTLAEVGEGQGHRDYEVVEGADEARDLILQGFAGPRRLEVWWAGPGERWSPYRSVRWLPGGSRLAVGLERLPHWRRGEVRRVRVVSADSRPLGEGCIGLSR